MLRLGLGQAVNLFALVQSCGSIPTIRTRRIDMSVEKVVSEISQELNEFMVNCLKRHVRDLQFMDKPPLIVIAALVDALAMQVVFNELEDAQVLTALQKRLEGVRHTKAAGSEPPKVQIDLEPKAKA
jgi:hypothetical protein